jgi:hypothetical protein
MTAGSQSHEHLYGQFAKVAKPATAEEMLTESKVGAIYSREFEVIDLEHGIYGLIDLLTFTYPDIMISMRYPMMNFHGTPGGSSRHVCTSPDNY